MDREEKENTIEIIGYFSDTIPEDEISHKKLVTKDSIADFYNVLLPDGRKLPINEYLNEK
jgi:hypothetical protein